MFSAFCSRINGTETPIHYPIAKLQGGIWKMLNDGMRPIKAITIITERSTERFTCSR